jgi:hypothetical protein
MARPEVEVNPGYRPASEASVEVALARKLAKENQLITLLEPHNHVAGSAIGKSRILQVMRINRLFNVVNTLFRIGKWRKGDIIQHHTYLTSTLIHVHHIYTICTPNTPLNNPYTPPVYA